MEGGRGPGQAASEWWVGRSPRALALGAALGHQRHRGGDRGHTEPQLQPQCAGSQQQPAPGGPAGAPRLARSPVSALPSTLAPPELRPHGPSCGVQRERMLPKEAESQEGRPRGLREGAVAQAWSLVGHLGHLPPCPGLRVAWALSHTCSSKISLCPSHPTDSPRPQKPPPLPMPGGAVGPDGGAGWVVGSHMGRKGHGGDGSHGKKACEFPRAAVTKYHKVGGFKQQRFMASHFWRSEVQNQGVAGLCSLCRL